MGAYANGVYVPTPAEVGWDAELNDFLTRSGNAYIDVTLAPYDADPTGVADSTAAVEAAIADLPASGGTIFFPPGIYRVSGVVLLKAGVRFVGAGRYATTLKTTSGDMFTLGNGLVNQLYGVTFEHMKLHSTVTGGDIFVQDGVVALSLWFDLFCLQENPAQHIYYDDDKRDFVQNVWKHCELQAATTPTVSPFYLYSTGGDLNSNSWEDIRVSNSAGTDAFFYVENDVGVGQSWATYNRWFQISGEICTGGVIDLRCAKGNVLDQVISWDLTTATNDMIRIRAATSGGLSPGNTISNYGGGVVGIGGKYDIKLGSFECLDTSITNPDTTRSPGNVSIDFGNNSGCIVGHIATLDNADAAIVLGRYSMRSLVGSTGNQASPTGIEGHQSYDTTRHIPIWSDGSDWRNAVGEVDRTPGLATLDVSVPSAVPLDASAGHMFNLIATGSAYTILSPTNDGGAFGAREIVVCVMNNSGGAITTTWSSDYHLTGAWVDPANAKARLITFRFDEVLTTGAWLEVSRSAGDIG